MIVSRRIRYNDDKERYEVREGGTAGIWREAIEVECCVCHTPFYICKNETSGPRAERRHLCSNSCQRLFVRLQAEKKRVTNHCIVCRQPFRVAQATGHRYKTCGKRECYQAVRSANSKAIQANRRYRKFLILQGLVRELSCQT